MPMKKGRMGMTTAVTICRAMLWNSWSNEANVLDFVADTDSPRSNDSNNADITGMMGVISRLNSTVGRGCRDSVTEGICSMGTRV